MVPSTSKVAALKTTIMGTIDVSMVKIEPKRICCVAPVVALRVASR